MLATLSGLKSYSCSRTQVVTVSSYYLEAPGSQYWRAHVATIHQLFAQNCTFPFLWLDPAYAWQGGFDYWENRLRNVMAEMAHTQNKTYREALSDMAGRLAVIQRVPYRSQVYPTGLEKKLPSAIMAKEYANQMRSEGRCVIPQ